MWLWEKFGINCIRLVSCKNLFSWGKEYIFCHPLQDENCQWCCARPGSSIVMITACCKCSFSHAKRSRQFRVSCLDFMNSAVMEINRSCAWLWMPVGAWVDIFRCPRHLWKASHLLSQTDQEFEGVLQNRHHVLPRRLLHFRGGWSDA